MALRVLLADNSETIKKAVQVTLQDYAIDLRVVNLGVDVIDVALKFKPDIIFVDILLQKKSGYEVSHELKTHAQLGNIPVVLMWSGFMEFDEKKAQESLADARIEKPFDVQTLRGLVQKFVGKTKSNPLAGFVDLPTVPQEPGQSSAPAKKYADPLKELEKIKNESQKFSTDLNLQPLTPATRTLAPAPAAAPAPSVPPPIPKNTAYQLPDIDADEEFEMKPLSPPKASGAGSHKLQMDDEMTKSFVLDIPDDATMDDMPVDFGKIEKVEDLSFLNPPMDDVAPVPVRNTPQPPPTIPVATPTMSPPPIPTPTLPDHAQLEKMIQDEVSKRVSEIAEKVAWQVIPELASQIIKKELDRLLKG